MERKPTYWIMLKNGGLRIQSAQPKNRPYVAELSTEVKGDWQHYLHAVTSFTAEGKAVKTLVFDTYCGYDRGPGHDMRIREMLVTDLQVKAA